MTPVSNFITTCGMCNYIATTSDFIDILDPEEINCGIYAWVRCPKCQYEEEA